MQHLSFTKHCGRTHNDGSSKFYETVPDNVAKFDATSQAFMFVMVCCGYMVRTRLGHFAFLWMKAKTQMANEGKDPITGTLTCSVPSLL